jgi:hypothetical protein
LTAPPEGLGKYRNTFTNGWEYHREQRLARQKALGIADPNWTLSPPEHGHAWSELSASEKDTQDLALATHAAMVENIDKNVGRVVDLLKASGVYSNTVIFYLSDNGASDEGGNGGLSTDKRLSEVGANWANTPYRLYKMHTREGGISTPLIVHWAAGITNWGLRSQPGHLIDLMPTVLELAGATYPTNFHGNPITPPEGRSLVHTFANTNIEPRLLFFEHEGNRAVRSYDWKLVANGRTGPWELFDLAGDRTETTNLAALYPTIVMSLSNTWEAMAWRVWSYPSPDRNLSLKMRVWPTVEDAIAGDGDGWAEPGETVDLRLPTIKQGSGPNTGLTGSLGSSDPRVTILADTAPYGDFSSGTASNLTTFRIHIAADMPVNDTIRFGLTLRSGAIEQWSESFALQVRSFTSVTGLVTELGTEVTIAGASLAAGALAATNSDAFGRYGMLLEPGQYEFTAAGPVGYAPTQQVLRVSMVPQALPVGLMWTNTGLDLRLDRPTLNSITLPLNATLLLRSTVHNGPYPGAGPVTINWSALSGPAAPLLERPDRDDTPVSFPALGTYMLQAIASNGSQQATQTLQVLVSTNLGAVIEPPTNARNVWLKFDDASGTTTALDSAHTNHSLLLNMNASTAWTGDGARGGCLAFDGADDTVNLPNGPDSNSSVNRTRTVCLWFYAENPGLATKQVLFEDGGVTRGMNFYLENGSLIFGAWNTPANESGWAGTWFTVPGIQAQRWYHVALSLNGGKTVTQDALIGYLGGSEIGRGQGSQIWGRGSKNGLGAMYDAARFQDGSQNGNGDYFSGRLDDFRIYERVLTASELADLARSGIAHAVVQANAGPDVLNHNGLHVPLQPSTVTYGTPNVLPLIGWDTVTSPSTLPPLFSQPDADGIPTLASLPGPGEYGLRLVADTGEIATCDDLNVTAIHSFAEWIAGFEDLPPNQQTPDADPDSDGIPNRIEYELGTAPTASGSPDGRGCLSLLLADAGAALELSFLLRRDATARGLIYGVRLTSSVSPPVWVDQPYTLLAVESSPDYEFERVRFRLNPSGAPFGAQAFMHLWFAQP